MNYQQSKTGNNITNETQMLNVLGYNVSNLRVKVLFRIKIFRSLVTINCEWYEHHKLVLKKGVS